MTNYELLIRVCVIFCGIELFALYTSATLIFKMGSLCYRNVCGSKLDANRFVTENVKMEPNGTVKL